MAISPQLLEVLVCPESHAPLVEDREALVSTDVKTRRRFRVEDDIPNMILEDSEVLDAATWTEIMQRHGVLPASSGGEEPGPS